MKPSLGGIAIFLGLFVANLIWMPISDLAEYKYLFGSLFIMFLIGVRDDLYPLRPAHKLIGQILAASIVITLNGVSFNSLYGLLGVYELPMLLGYAISLFTFVVVTNSFNLIDGIDGLAGSISLLALSSFGIWFYLIDEQVISILIFSFAGAILGFLYFNWAPSKIFMGDTGALLIGFFLSVCTIFFIDYNFNLPTGNPYKFTAGIATAICVIIMPLFDTLRIFISRIIRKRSPFSPDKNHIHHILMRFGFGHRETVFILGFVNLVFIFIAILLGRTLNDHVLIPIVIAVTVVFSLLLDFFIMKKYYLTRKKEAESQQEVI
ncbi:MraY family glycosyltransferase [Rapidithrix thailandica]|uniref:MraY family glycosyltransferase n=1 Tax=Rapidithrix thailandica TaxID=413964 RepID=A0AAW9S5P6_9BACT